MSGHCPKCGTYHEEDDDRVCPSCKPKPLSIEDLRAAGLGLPDGFSDAADYVDSVRHGGKDARIAALEAQVKALTEEITTLRDAMEDIVRENNEQAESLNKIIDNHGGWDDSIDTYAGHFERIINTLTEERDANRRLLNKALKDNALLRAECEAWRKNDDQYDDADESNTLWKAAYKARAATDAAGALKGVE